MQQELIYTTSYNLTFADDRKEVTGHFYTIGHFPDHKEAFRAIYEAEQLTSQPSYAFGMTIVETEPFAYPGHKFTHLDIIAHI